MRITNGPWIKLIIGVLVLIGIILIFRNADIDFSGITPQRFRDKIHSYGIWGPTMYILFYVLRPLILFPASILSASAGVIWGIKGLVYLLIGANISAIVEFLIARYFARDAIARLVKGKTKKFDNAVEKHGFTAVLLIRLIPNVAYDIQNLSLGLTKVKFRDYFFATFIGIIPLSFVFVYFGTSIIKVLTDPRNFWMILVAVILIIGVMFLRKCF